MAKENGFLRNCARGMQLMALVCAGCACIGEKDKGETGNMETRMDRGRLNIGAYTLQPYARTERHIREIRDCGIDFMVCVPYDRQMLDLFAKYGIGAIVNEVLPGWWGNNGENAGRLHEINPIKDYQEAAKTFRDHPAIWGMDIGDEPSALDFPYYGKVFKCVEQSFPRQFPYLNLYPNYASVAENSDSQKINQLGTTTYAEHIDRYCENMPSDYICYDYYLYAAGVAGHYENLRIVANACRRSGRSLWIVLQVNSNRPEAWITENQLRMQANSALAFGAENIIWACYTKCWWHNQVVDDNGEKTQQYAKLQKVNGEIHALAEDYMRFRNTSTHFVGFRPGSPDTAKLNDTPLLESLSTGVFQDVRADDGSPVIVGQMAPRKSRDGSAALFICAADDPLDLNPRSFHVNFRCDGFNVSANGGELTRNQDGSYSLSMKSCGGALVMARP